MESENKIEKDIKIIETFLKGNKTCEDCKNYEGFCADCYIEYEEVQAIAHILADYKRIVKELYEQK